MKWSSIMTEHYMMPDFHDLSVWQNYKGPYCRWMIDTGNPAPGACNSHIVECTNPQSPIAQTFNNGQKIKWKTRFCHPNLCRFFEF
jgi:hypothetical protein